MTLLRDRRLSDSERELRRSGLLPECRTGILQPGLVEQHAHGWAAGGGIEWKIASSWNVKAEYLYVDLGNSSYNSRNTSALFPGATITHNHNLTDNILRIGFNYQFSWGPGWFAQY